MLGIEANCIAKQRHSKAVKCTAKQNSIKRKGFIMAKRGQSKKPGQKKPSPAQAPQPDKIGPVKVEAVEVKPIESAMIKAETDSQIAQARRYPRDIQGFQSKCRTLATHDEAIAASCFYVIPRAGKMIEGPSVRLAEIALSCYGNCIALGDVSHDDGRFVFAVGMCRDLENNVAIRQTVRRRITNKDGRRFDDDMISVTANAAVSIALRNAILRIIPRAYVNPIMDECKKVAGGKAETMTKLRQNVFEYIGKTFGVNEERILAAIKKRSRQELDKDDLTVLRGMITAIQDGDATVETVFPKLTKEPTDKEKLEATPTKSPDEAPDEAPVEKTEQEQKDFNAKRESQKSNLFSSNKG